MLFDLSKVTKYSPILEIQKLQFGLIIWRIMDSTIIVWE